MVHASALDCRPLISGLEQDLSVSSETVARALEVDRRTVDRWRTNQTVPHGRTRERLGDLLTLRDRLLAVMGTREAASEWLHSRSLYLGGFTPEEALRAGRLDRVPADLDGLMTGVYL